MIRYSTVKLRPIQRSRFKIIDSKRQLRLSTFPRDSEGMSLEQYKYCPDLANHSMLRLDATTEKKVSNFTLQIQKIA